MDKEQLDRILDAVSKEVKSWPEWMQRPENRQRQPHGNGSDCTHHQAYRPLPLQTAYRLGTPYHPHNSTSVPIGTACDGGTPNNGTPQNIKKSQPDDIPHTPTSSDTGSPCPACEERHGFLGICCDGSAKQRECSAYQTFAGKASTPTAATMLIVTIRDGKYTIKGNGSVESTQALQYLLGALGYAPLG